MSDTHVNAYVMELADKEAQLATLAGEVDALKRQIASMPVDATPEVAEVAPTPTAPTPAPEQEVPSTPTVTEIEVTDGDANEPTEEPQTATNSGAKK